MFWATGLLILDTIGVALLLAILAGWSVDGLVYVAWFVCLLYLGLATLLVQLIRYLIQSRVLGQSGGWGFHHLGRRIRGSIVFAAAGLTIGTTFFMSGGFRGEFSFGADAYFLTTSLNERFALILGAAAIIASALTLVRNLGHYARWRSLCLRRESGGRH